MCGSLNEKALTDTYYSVRYFDHKRMDLKINGVLSGSERNSSMAVVIVLSTLNVTLRCLVLALLQLLFLLRHD